MCMPLSQVNFLFVLYFIAFGIGGMLTFPVMDKIGRRKTHYIFSTIHVMGQACLIFVPSYYAKAAGYCILGLAMAKNSLCYTWLFEFMVKDKKSIANTAINIMEFLCMIIAGLYFMFVSDNSQPLLIGYFGLTALGGWLIVTSLCVESPKWLLI